MSLIRITINILILLVVAFVVRVVDGDTIDVIFGNGIEDRVRLIGIDAPERGNREAEEATAFLESLILNRLVWIETDIEHRDRYNRFLGYVWLNGEMINLRLIKEGYAVPYEYPPNTKYGDILINETD